MHAGARGAVCPIVVAVACSALAGCAVPGTRDGGAPTPDPRVTAALASYEPLVQTVEWSELDGLVSVVARNEAGRVLTGARARLTVLDSAGTPLTLPDGEATESVLDADVLPGSTYAFTLDLGEGADVDRVEVAYADVSWGATGPAADTGRVDLRPAVLTANGAGAVVGARAVTTEGPVSSAVVQARLQAPDGRLVAVATTAADCFDPRVQRRVWLQLDRHVPEGTTTGLVTAYPRTPPDLGGTATSPDC